MSDYARYSCIRSINSNDVTSRFDQILNSEQIDVINLFFCRIVGTIRRGNVENDVPVVQRPRLGDILARDSVFWF